jgi:hypothetical protein
MTSSRLYRTCRDPVFSQNNLVFNQNNPVFYRNNSVKDQNDPVTTGSIRSDQIVPV